MSPTKISRPRGGAIVWSRAAIAERRAKRMPQKTRRRAAMARLRGNPLRCVLLVAGVADWRAGEVDVVARDRIVLVRVHGTSGGDVHTRSVARDRALGDVDDGT